MKRNSLFVALIVMGCGHMLGCSTAAAPEAAVPEPVMVNFGPYEKFVPGDDPETVVGRLCQLGTSCLSLDPRPFEMCLLASGKHCGEKITESLLATNPDPDPAEPR